MGHSPSNDITPFARETPRRDAMRAMSTGIAGAALLGALGRASAPAAA